MDQAIRNKLRNVVTQCRKLLEDAVSQVLQGQFGIYPTGKKDEVHVEDESRMSHLAEEDRACRRDLLDHFDHIQALGYRPKDALAQLVREIAFTHLNRLCAYRMMEARGVVINGRPFREAVSRGLKSQGFLFYLAEHPEDEKRYNTGHQDVAYRHFLDWLGGTLSEEIGVLFSPNDPANRLYPPQRVLDAVLDLINTGDIKPEEAELQKAWPAIWSADETIGWVYQYFTPKELRDQARKESAAPRNSYELAFRNQFFTPRYVVEFLTDNTLGRIWYEMRKGRTRLTDQCRYMVRRPSEVFLTEGESHPSSSDAGAGGKGEDLSQEELLKQPVHIPHRPKKDPRELKILDPACGSGHFLLYCFDLLETIYEEAYDDPDLRPALKRDYPTQGDLRRSVPGLILAHNLHGIDIDLRATQIAALALWLRCQRAYQEQEIKKERPRVTKSNIVCAEPMPGEKEMLKEFVADVQPRVLGHLVEVVFDKMQLAGEAGSLLKVEEELREAIAAAKRQWVSEHELAVDRKGRTLLFSRAEMERVKNKSPQPQLFDFSEITEEQFWNEAESRVVEALRDYATHAANGGKLRRQLFAEDAAHGFAFIDVCQKRFDVVLMNPPFGLPIKSHASWMKTVYPDAYVDIYSTFLSRAFNVCVGKIGVISSRSILLTKKLLRLRRNLILPRIEALLDLGWAVMDGATVQSCAYVADAGNAKVARSFLAIDRNRLEDKTAPLVSIARCSADFCYLADRVALTSLPRSKMLYALPPRILSLLSTDTRLGSRVLLAKLGMKTFNDFRFLRLRCEVDPRTIGKDRVWEPLAKGGPYAVFYSDLPLLVKWNRTGDEIAQENIRANGQTAQAKQASIYYRRPGATYSRRSSRDFGVRMLPAGCIIGEKGPAVLPCSGYSSEFVIGLLNSRFINAVVHLQANAKQYDSGIIESLPWKEARPTIVAEVEELTRKSILAVRDVVSLDETDSVFVGLPAGSSVHDMWKRWNDRVAATRAIVQSSLARITECVDSVFDVDSKEMSRLVKPGVAEAEGEEEPTNDEDEDEGQNLFDALTEDAVAKPLVSASIGSIFGRWNVQHVFGQGTRTPPPLFQPLPSVPPVALQDRNGLPASETPEGYPLSIDWDGILVDDPDHSDDIVRRLRDVFELVWKESAEPVEKEVCEILGVKELRDYFRKPGKGGFWDDHVARHSKSRRTLQSTG